MSDTPELDNGIRTRLSALVSEASATHADHAGEVGARRRRHVEELLATGLKLLSDGCDVSQIKLIENAVKEIRRSYRVFNRFRGVQKSQHIWQRAHTGGPPRLHCRALLWTIHGGGTLDGHHRRRRRNYEGRPRGSKP